MPFMGPPVRAKDAKHRMQVNGLRPWFNILQGKYLKDYT